MAEPQVTGMRSMHQAIGLCGLALIPAFPLATGQRDMLPVGIVLALPFLVSWLGLYWMKEGAWRTRLVTAAAATGFASLGVYVLVLASGDPFVGMLGMVTLPAQSIVAIGAFITGLLHRLRR